ncbi:MAG: SBBP repeat-containing protein [Ignavibacteria bacterium]|nr:SBBP repeat-containing protein [Ignavibacteria bacterium]
MIWKQSLDWTGHRGDDPNFIAVDENHNVYVTGYGYVGPPPLLKEDLVIAKYNINGELQWANSYSNSTPQSSVGYSISINDSNNIYVSGYSGDSIIIIKYSSSGFIEWLENYYCISINLVVPLFSKTDHQSNVIINGYYELAGQSNFVTLKYDEKGNLLWDRIFDSPIGTLDIANAINMDDSSNIFIAGRTFTKFYNDVFVLKYASNGDTLWSRTYDHGFSQNDEAKSIACDALGNVYVTGNTQSPITSNDFLTIKYDKNGNLIWKKTYSTTTNPPGQDFGISINLDRNSNVFVSGSCYLQNGRYGITSIKYSQITNAQNISNSVMGYKLNNFPNPFNPITKIEYEMPEDAFLSINIVDSKGKLILAVLNEYKKSGKYSIDFVAKNLASGVYYCVMEANKLFIKSKKLILLK